LCLRYVIPENFTTEYRGPNTPEHPGLAVGLSAGFGVLLIIAIAVIIVLVLYIRLRKKPTEETHAQNDNDAGSIELYEAVNYESYYSTIPDNVYSSTCPVEPDETDKYTGLEIPDYLTVLPDNEC